MLVPRCWSEGCPGKDLHKALAEIAALARALEPHGVVIGGDFNAARHFDKVYGGARHQRFFDAMAAAGFYDVHFGKHGKEIQSFWGRQTKQPYQDDHFFVSQCLAPRVIDCFVVDNELVRKLSDHGPVVLELDVA